MRPAKWFWMANNKTEIALALIRIKQQDRRIPIGFGGECDLTRKPPDKPEAMPPINHIAPFRRPCVRT